MADRGWLLNPRCRLPVEGWVGAALELFGHLAIALLVFPQVACWMPEAIFPDRGDPRLIVTILRWGSQHSLLDPAVWHAPWLFPHRSALAFSDHLLGVVPFFEGFRRLLGSDAAAYGSLFLASYALTSWGTQRLLLRWRAPTFLAWVLGLAVAYAPWRTDQIPHLQMLWQPGLPWLFLAFDRLLARPRWLRVPPFLLLYALTVSAGSYLAYLSHLVLLVLLGVRLSSTRKRLLRARAQVILGSTALAALAVAWPFFFPYLQARAALGLVRSPAEIEQYAARFESWFSPAVRSAYAPLWPEGWVQPEQALFPGFLLSLLTLAGLGSLPFLRGGRAMPWSCLERGLALAGLLFLLLAHRDPFLLLARILPGLDGMRVPTRGAPFFLLGCAVLAGRGARIVQQRLGARGRSWASAGMLLLLLPDLSPRVFPASERIVLERPEELPSVHRVLAQREDVRAVALVPVPRGEWATLEMLRATVHRRPIGAGHSGFEPWTVRAQEYHCRYPEAQLGDFCHGALEELGFTHLIVRDVGLRSPLRADEVWGRVGSVLAPEVADRFELVAWDEEHLLFALRSSPEPRQ